MDNISLNSNEINSKIEDLANNSEKMVCLARKYVHLAHLPQWSVAYLIEKYTGIVGRSSDYLLSQRGKIDIAELPVNNPQACGCTASAFFAQNMFKQQYIQRLHSLNELTNGLQDSEPGLFKIAFPGLDHVMILIKFFENGTPKYRVVQSYAERYDLSEFMEKYSNEFEYESYEELKDKFLEPLTCVIFDVADKTTLFEKIKLKMEEFKKLTKVKLSHHPFVSHNSSLNQKFSTTDVFDSDAITILRTTDVSQENSYSSKTFFHALINVELVALLALTSYGLAVKAKL